MENEPPSDDQGAELVVLMYNTCMFHFGLNFVNFAQTVRPDYWAPT